MKAILKFDLPEEQKDLYYAQNGAIAFIVVQEILNMFRDKNKYCKYPEWQEETAEAIEKRIREIISEEELILP
jgi:hypothetical protein